MSNLNPYLHFRGQAREALTFYREALGGELSLMEFGDQGGGLELAEGESAWIMHGQLETPAGFVLMASDLPSALPLAEGTNMRISLSGSDEAELRGYWDRLVEGGTVGMPLAAAPWGGFYGDLADRFGVGWLVNINPA